MRHISEIIPEAIAHIPKIELYNQDCLEALIDMPDKCYDLAIVDPPYGTGWDGEVPSMVREGVIGSNGWKKKSSGYVRKNWDKVPTEKYFNELFRVSKHQIIWGGNYFDLPPTKGYFFWDKQTGDFSLGDGELAWTNVTGAVRKFTYRWSGFLKGPNGNVREDRIHPTQKPISLYKWLLKNYAQPNQKILDTHLGSGSIAIACHDLGFDLTAFEIDEEYYKAALKRYNDHKQQLKLF